jgi:hypothetical protein
MEDYLCVTMYLLMCDSCKIKLTLLDHSNVNVIEQDFSQLVVSHLKPKPVLRKNSYS